MELRWTWICYGVCRKIVPSLAAGFLVMFFALAWPCTGAKSSLCRIGELQRMSRQGVQRLEADSHGQRSCATNANIPEVVIGDFNTCRSSAHIRP